MTGMLRVIACNYAENCTPPHMIFFKVVMKKNRYFAHLWKNAFIKDANSGYQGCQFSTLHISVGSKHHSGGKNWDNMTFVI